jgi:Holliday junction resolvasome RuvABC ATP-dependent DNA helicase subunit
MANGQYVTIFLDEACHLPTDLTKALLSIFKENEPITKFYYDGAEISFDLHKITWIFATSEPQGVFHSLFDRFENIDLVDYDNSEMAKIIELSVKKLNPNFTFEGDVLLDAADTCRGNGRSAAKLATHIHRQLVSVADNNFTSDKWKKLVKVFQIKPKGLDEREIILLKALKTEGQCSLTRLSSVIGMTKEAVQKKTEIHLLKLGLIVLETPAGRKLTQKGHEYLALLEKE